MVRAHYSAPLVVLWEVLLLVVIKSPYATVNGSNSAGKLTIEVSQGESVPIRCSAYLWRVVRVGFMELVLKTSEANNLRGFESHTLLQLLERWRNGIATDC